MNQDLAKELISRYEDLKSKRDGVFMNDWEYISKYFLPQDSNITVQKTEGVNGWTDLIFDTTAIEAAETLKTGQYNWLTPPNQPWGEYTVPDELKDGEGAEDYATAWLGKASDIIGKERARSNFYSIASMSYLGVGTFGTDLMLCEEGKKTLFNYRHARIGTYCIEEDDEGVVDTTMREFEMTFRQAKQMFGEDALPDKMKQQVRGASGLKKKFKFLHCIFPREDSDRIPTRKDGANKPIASIYIAIEFNECVSISGYDEQPALCSRFDKWGTDSPWGYGPSYLGLPIARQLNYVQQFLDALAELHAYPRVLIPDGLEGDVDLRAGGATTWDSSDPNAKPSEWATVGDYKLGLEMQEQRRQALRKMFMTDAFKLLNSMPLLDKKMTAFEISQRQAENLTSFTPSLGRRITEFLNPLMIREFGIAYRAGILGQAPDSLMVDLGSGKRGLRMPGIKITNRLTDALRALKNRATEETFQFLMPQVEAGRPECLDIFDMDNVNRDYALNAGMSPDLIRARKGPNSIASLREARAKVQQQNRAAELAEQTSKAGKNLSASPSWLQDQAKEAMTGR
jgi:hypothetical protein